VTIQYEIALEDELLLVVASGFDESLKEVQGYGMAVIGAAVEHQVTRILCDERRLEDRLGTMDTFQAASYIAENARCVGRTAVVCDSSSMRDTRFWEDVSRNRGLQAAMFTDLAEARAWLDAQGRTDPPPDDH
jgi:hypothetical protein